MGDANVVGSYAWARAELQRTEQELSDLRQEHREKFDLLAWILKKWDIPEDATGVQILGLMNIAHSEAHGYRTYIVSNRCGDKQGEIARLEVLVKDMADGLKESDARVDSMQRDYEAEHERGKELEAKVAAAVEVFAQLQESVFPLGTDAALVRRLNEWGEKIDRRAAEMVETERRINARVREILESGGVLALTEGDKPAVEGRPNHGEEWAYCPKCMRAQRDRNATECERCGGPTKKGWVAKKEEAAARTVTVSGPLGSGKTTVARLLVESLRSRGVEVELGEMPESDKKRLSEPGVEYPPETKVSWWPVRVEIRHEGQVEDRGVEDGATTTG